MKAEKKSYKSLEKIRDFHRELASENAARRSLCSPNGERWELWNDEFQKHAEIADVIDECIKCKINLTVNEKVVNIPFGISKYDAPEGIEEIMNPAEAYADGWNNCIESMRMKSSSLDQERLSVYEGIVMRVCDVLQSHNIECIDDPSEALEFFLEKIVVRN